MGTHIQNKATLKVEILYPKQIRTSKVRPLRDPTYIRNPLKEIMNLSKHETKILIIARYGMLECGKISRAP